MNIHDQALTVEQFKHILPELCAADTSLDSSCWHEKHPTYGHCAVVALLAQELFGGTLLRISLDKLPSLVPFNSHYFNKLADNTIVDFTIDQFEGNLPTDLLPEKRDREHLLKNSDTLDRVHTLKLRFNTYLIKNKL